MRVNDQLLEEDMENLIGSNPAKYLEEEGLDLLQRQYTVGNYRFDLLFQDRHGAKLIVEIQRGTLDRNHTYKILDYYDEYKSRNPKEFVELMVVANKITSERRNRLRSYGISFKEIPESVFLGDKKDKMHSEDLTDLSKTHNRFPESLDYGKTEVSYLKQSGKFLVILTTKIEQFSNTLKNKVGISFEIDYRGGYVAKNMIIEIPNDDKLFFIAHWSGKDVTRFPARIKALATALRDCSLYGQFDVSHESGKFTLRKLTD